MNSLIILIKYVPYEKNVTWVIFFSKLDSK